MKKNFIMILCLSTIIAFMIGVIVIMKGDKTISYTEDEIKFKEEYESLNGTDYESTNLVNINIDSDNHIKYLYDFNILEYLKEKDCIIFFGWPQDNYSRTVLPILIESIKKNKIDNLYYFNFKTLKSSYENNNDIGKIELYNNIMDFLKIKGEVREIIPSTVVFVKNGKLIGTHEKSLDYLTYASELSESDKKSLASIYNDLIKTWENK